MRTITSWQRRSKYFICHAIRTFYKGPFNTSEYVRGSNKWAFEKRKGAEEKGCSQFTTCLCLGVIISYTTKWGGLFDNSFSFLLLLLLLFSSFSFSLPFPVYCHWKKLLCKDTCYKSSMQYRWSTTFSRTTRSFLSAILQEAILQQVIKLWVGDFQWWVETWWNMVGGNIQTESQKNSPKIDKSISHFSFSFFRFGKGLSTSCISVKNVFPLQFNFLSLGSKSHWVQNKRFLHAKFCMRSPGWGFYFSHHTHPLDTRSLSRYRYLHKKVNINDNSG